MSVLNFFKTINRRHWFVCHACMMNSNHDPLKSIFFQNSPGKDFMGRMMYPCPRCASTNTRSFKMLQDDGSTQQLFGLERIVRQHPRHIFEVDPTKSAAV